MQTLSQITEPEVILEFLNAEIGSPRWASELEQLLQQEGYDKSLISRGDTSDDTENAVRKEILYQFRDCEDKRHFHGLPEDIVWHTTLLSGEDIAKLRYMNYPFWVNLSGWSRLAIEGAGNLERAGVRSDLVNHIKQTAKLIIERETLPRIILLAKSIKDDPVILEGHIRATAYCLNIEKMSGSIEAIVGYSKNIESWKWY